MFVFLQNILTFYCFIIWNWVVCLFFIWLSSQEIDWRHVGRIECQILNRDRTFPPSFSRSRTLYIFFHKRRTSRSWTAVDYFFCWIVSKMVTWDYVAQQQCSPVSQYEAREVCAALFLLSLSPPFWCLSNSFFLLRFFLLLSLSLPSFYY